jgi:predicted regulator of Ras-like GTPase activity (Roadblock/LC7/MglB family)
MTIPFVDLFRKVAARFGGGATTSATETAATPAAPAKSVRPKRTGHESLSKTVLPNRTRSFSAPDPLRAAATVSANQNPATSMQLSSGKVVTGARPASRARELPRALALALEPKFERAISLKISDFIEQVPAGYIKPVEILDTNACVSLKASEIEKGMADGKPTIALPSLYQQVPEIFLRSVPLDDETRVPLPYENVLEQFNSVKVRQDQEIDHDVPQVDTPILQATIEDTKRFGTKMEPLQASALPPVPVAPATAKTIAHAEPEPVAFETKKGGAIQAHPVVSLHAPEPAKKSEPAKPYPMISFDSTEATPKAEPVTPTVSLKPNSPLTKNEPVSKTLSPPAKTEPHSPEQKIPFQFPPNGTGGPDSERVPASSRPPVPIDLSASPAPLQLKLAPKPVESVAPSSLTPTVDKTEPPKPKPIAPVDVEKKKETEGPKQIAIPSGVGTKVVDVVEPLPKETVLSKKESVEEKTPIITAPAGDAVMLSLKRVLKNLPTFQLDGDVSAVADDAKIEFPLSLIAPQLASGRVTVESKIFQAAIPEKYRELFHADEANPPIGLPLQEVLENLPADVLNRRADQEETAETEEDFETPFFLKAKEDAERLLSVTTATVKPQPKPAPITTPEQKSEVQPGEKLDAKEVMAQASALSEVKACAITFADGLNLAGMLPPELRADGLCAMAPAVLQKIARHMSETKLGELKSMTLHSDGAAISFFAGGNVCLAALHADGALTNETQSRLTDLVQKLSRTYAQPETQDVHH